VNNIEQAFDSAERYFRSALSLCPQHADASYNMATLLIDRANYSKKYTSNISVAMNMLKDVISRDTSRRGETTGLAHRAIATALVKHHVSFTELRDIAAYDALLRDAKLHMRAACDILANHSQDLDTLIFEFCELLHPLWLSYLDMCKTASSTQPHEHESHTPQSVDAVLLTKAASLLSLVAEDLSASLQTERSSGIDLQVYELWAEYLNDFVEHTMQDRRITPDLDREYVTSSVGTWVEWLNTVANTLLILGNDNAEALVQGGDVQHSLLLLYTCLRDISSPEYILLIPGVCQRVFDSRNSAVELVPGLSTRSALAEEYMAMTRVLSHISDDSALTRSVLEVLRGVLAKAHAAHGDGGTSVGNADHVDVESIEDPAVGSAVEIAKLDMMREAKRIYESAIRQFEDDMVSKRGKGCTVAETERGSGEHSSDSDDDDDDDLLSVAYYNTACACWKLHDEEACEVYLTRHLDLEKTSSYSAVSEEADRRNTRSADATVIWNSGLDKIATDSDLEGIRARAWFSAFYEYI
jgi:hypothetical protein